MNSTILKEAKYRMIELEEDAVRCIKQRHFVELQDIIQKIKNLAECIATAECIETIEKNNIESDVPFVYDREENKNGL